MTRYYLDHAATSPLSPKAKEAMVPWLDCGNPSSLYLEGRKAKDVIDSARETLSDALGCLFAEVLFTSGGTEAANMAILGAAFANENPKRNRVLLGASEHHCVLHTTKALQRLGYKVDQIPVDRAARIDQNALADLVGEDVLLISVMHANNELGTLNNPSEIAQLAHTNGALYHCDAVQSFLNTAPWKVADHDADMLTVSAHKVNGPKGVGAIYLRAGVKISPLIHGGGQEREMRAGTENVAVMAGFAAAVSEHLKGKPDHRVEARRTFWSALNLPEAILSVDFESENVLPGHLHFRLPGVSAETMLILLDRNGVSASSGSACSSGSIEPSHVMLACGATTEQAKEGLRFTFGKSTTLQEAESAASIVREAALRLLAYRSH